MHLSDSSFFFVLSFFQIQTIQAYLDVLRIQQSQLALMSPHSQQSQMAAAAASAAANNAALVVVSPTGQNTTLHSLNSPNTAAAANASSTAAGSSPMITPVAATNQLAVESAANNGEAPPQSITAELDAIVIVLYGDASADATNKDPDPKTARESETQRQLSTQ